MILAAVAAEPLHGYAIMQKVGELSAGRVRIRAGTLYAALGRLVDEGLLEAEGEELVEGRRRRYYRITGAGVTELRREMDRLESNLLTIRTQLSRHASPEPT